jgi:hypothetical protein
VWELDEQASDCLDAHAARIGRGAAQRAICSPPTTIGNSNSSVCKNTQKNTNTVRKIFFLTVYPQKNTHRNRMTEKFNCSVGSPSETTRTEKLCSPRLKIKFLCINPHRKIEINTQKICIFLSVQLNSQKKHKNTQKIIYFEPVATTY